MKARILIVISVLIVLVGLLYTSGIKSGMQIGISNKPVHEYSSISDLQDSVNFNFQIPSAVGNGRIKKLCNYMNNIIEIDTDEINFRAAKFIAYDIDLGGNYSDYTIDNEYSNDEQEIWVRFRSGNMENTDDTASIVNLKIQDIAYTIKIYSQVTEDEALGIIGINKEGLVESNKLTDSGDNDDKVNDTDSEDIESDDTEPDDTGNNLYENISPDDIRYKQYESKDMQVTMMIPDIGDRLTVVYNNNILSFMVANKTVFIIEYNKDGYSDADISNQNTLKLDNNHLLRYVNNPFESGTQDSNDYTYLINGIDTLAMTFKSLN